ncbi:hypothetical protein [Candidatus Berkiella aquae]|uniref:Uncharacterized protein n=1 Tax=Candidatus Berkiella aquae TaxID=295108 RepID=A0A0Q9YKE7_9GAMM|nr:hypothetical protein [Candidatus Berkiella aquae]MCS5711138.1 hypothetical protein [Candidatus Berkiella aquae]
MAITNGVTPDFARKRKASETLAEQTRQNNAKKQRLDQENAKQVRINNENDQNEANTRETLKDAQKRKEKALKKRMATKDRTIDAFTKPHQTQGAMEKAEHLAGLTPEGVAGEIMFDLIILSIELSVNAPFWTQTLQFEAALLKELQSIESGENERLVYLPDDNGVYPEIYPIDDSGKVDYSKPPLTPGSPEISNFHIRANGYVPVPTISESLLTIFARHTERMSGTGALTAEQKSCLYNTVQVLHENQQKEKNEKDIASDNAARMAATKQIATPRLTAKA